MEVLREKFNLETGEIAGKREEEGLSFFLSFSGEERKKIIIKKGCGKDMWQAV